MRIFVRVLVAVAVLGVLSACKPAPPPVAWDPGPAWDQNPDTVARHTDPFLICVRRHESDRNDANHNGLYDAGYQALNRSGAAGAYQFLQRTWDTQANAIGRPDLVGRRPDTIWIIDQDLVAWTLSQGTHSPWAGSGC